MGVRIIRASRPPSEEAGGEPRKKIRVAAYCRVSTDSEEQESSYEAQRRHYAAYIDAHPDWEPAGIYADEGISGTSTKGRNRFGALIAACEKKQVDLVLTKSISRFARNTLDCLTYIRKLKALGIPIYFEKENINTMDEKGELLLTIMASIAQQESQSISQNVRMGIRYRMQEGKGRLDTTRFLGLTKENGALVIVPGEAETVRRIYRAYLEGFSPAWIARRLEEEGVPAPRGGARWHASTVSGILSNEKYAGDLLLQKYYTVDYLSHKIAKNTGQLPQYYVEDDHEPIVPRRVFFEVQGELARRGAARREPGPRFRYGTAEVFTGRLLCGCCGNTLKRFAKTDGREPDWRCRRRAGSEKQERSRAVRSACGCRFVPESQARQAVLAAFNRLPDFRNTLLEMRRRLEGDDLRRVDGRLDEARTAQRRLEERLRRCAPEQAEERAFLGGELERLRAGQNALTLERAEYCRRIMQLRMLLELSEDREAAESGAPESAACRDYEEFFRRTRVPLPEGTLDGRGRFVRFDGSLVLRYLCGLTVRRDGFDVHFKAGITVSV